MAISKNIYPGGQQVSPRYQKIEQDGSTGFIIIDDTVAPGISEAHTEVNRGVVWLKIEANYQVSVLAAEPSGLQPLGSHEPWNRLRLFVKANETFVIQYSGLPKGADTQHAVASYLLSGPTDRLYVKIDQGANTLTLYEEGMPT